MLYSQISTQLRQRGELLLSGQIDALVASYLFPLPVFLQSNLMILHRPEDAGAVLAVLRDALIGRSVVALRPQIKAVDLPRAGRFRVWVDWHELAIPAEGTHMSSAIYYCRQTEAGIRFEMVNYTRQSMPDLDPQFSEIARSA